MWLSFVDARHRLHAVGPTVGEVARHGDGSAVGGFVDHWRRSLLDVAPAAHVPRQLAVLDWLAANAPTDAEEGLTLCMGDARLGNALVVDDRVVALVDFEVAHLGNPAADVGYCVMSEVFTRMLSDRPATGIPESQRTWARGEAATGRTATDRDYWTALGTTVLCVTATRAMRSWDLPSETVDADNLVVSEWERLVDRAS